MKNRQKKLAVLLCTALTLSMLGGCGEKAVEETTEDIASVEACKPEVGDLSLSSDYIATISPDESVNIIPKTTAEVVRVNVEAGDVVEEGDVLAVLDDTMAQINAKSAQISYDNAQHAYNMSYGEGAETLNDMNSDTTLDSAQTSVSDLQESLVDAMTTLDEYKGKLKDAEDELKSAEDDLKSTENDLKSKEENYNSLGTPNEITDPAELLNNNPLTNILDYQSEMTSYQNAATKKQQCQAKVDSYKQAIDQCEETIEQLQDNINKGYESYGKAVVSDDISNGEIRDENRQVSENSISSAQLGIDQANENLKSYTIRASISGTIESVNLKEHEFATTSSPAFVISNKDSMVATYYVSEDVRNTFSIGQKVSVTKDDKSYNAEVIEIGTAVDQTTGLFKIKAAIKGDTSGLLSGTKATVTTDTYNEKNALIIPYDALYFESEQAYLYIVEDGKAKKVEVTTGLFDESNAVITDGISKDDMVITTWSAQLRDGVKVSIQNADSDNQNETTTDDSTQE